ncbi:hypothetical protein CK203_055166 [Vitis vinifera]|uniref:Uncharacterized protein n=1 Tax=Vitis vinifera TaxID=29760 RepID=A0A438GMX4_VITVI|nr:hypothetical protein CK203_055166 [Vitis vinifera]
MVGNQEAQHGFDKSRVEEMFGLNELEEMRNDAYLNSKIAKERLKKWHDQLAPLDAPPHLPDSAPQRRYHTRRAAATPVAPTHIPPKSPPTKKAKTSEPGESSRAPRNSQSQPPPTKRPILASLPIAGNSIADQEHSMSRHILITLFCDSSLSWGFIPPT